MSGVKNASTEAEHLILEAQREAYCLALRDAGVWVAEAAAIYRSRWGDDPSADMMLIVEGEAVTDNAARKIADKTITAGLDALQVACLGTAQYPGKGGSDGLMYTALGLSNEAGEVLGKLKKLMRDHRNGLAILQANSVEGALHREAVAMEVADVLWYAVVLLDELDFDAGDVAIRLLNKLASRKERGVIQGSGDNR